MSDFVECTNAAVRVNPTAANATVINERDEMCHEIYRSRDKDLFN